MLLGWGFRVRCAAFWKAGLKPDCSLKRAPRAGLERVWEK